MDPFEGDEAWRDLIFLALDHGTGSIEAPDVGPLIPFALTHGPDGRQLVRFAGTDYATDCASALRFAHEGGFLHWAVAWDGFLTLEGTRTDAIFVRAGRAGGAQEVLFAWRYDRDAEGALRRIGNPTFLGAP